MSLIFLLNIDEMWWCSHAKRQLRQSSHSRRSSYSSISNVSSFFPFIVIIFLFVIFILLFFVGFLFHFFSPLFQSHLKHSLQQMNRQYASACCKRLRSLLCFEYFLLFLLVIWAMFKSITKCFSCSHVIFAVTPFCVVVSRRDKKFTQNEKGIAWGMEQQRTAEREREWVRKETQKRIGTRATRCYRMFSHTLHAVHASVIACCVASIVQCKKAQNFQTNFPACSL